MQIMQMVNITLYTLSNSRKDQRSEMKKAALESYQQDASEKLKFLLGRSGVRSNWSQNSKFVKILVQNVRNECPEKNQKISDR